LQKVEAETAQPAKISWMQTVWQDISSGIFLHWRQQVFLAPCLKFFCRPPSKFCYDAVWSPRRFPVFATGHKFCPALNGLSGSQGKTKKSFE